ncbi:MAG: MauE/DoxX family redox-associated membrane protein [Phycisphaerales bacterium]
MFVRSHKTHASRPLWSDRPDWVASAAAALSLLLGVGWAWAGVSKLLAAIGLLANSNPDWASSFHPALQVTATTAECGCAWLILSNRARLGLTIGLILVTIFTVAFWIWPPAAGQNCGCGFETLSLLAAHPFARNTLFGATHVFALALSAQSRESAACRFTTEKLSATSRAS